MKSATWQQQQHQNADGHKLHSTYLRLAHILTSYFVLLLSLFSIFFFLSIVCAHSILHSLVWSIKKSSQLRLSTLRARYILNKHNCCVISLYLSLARKSANRIFMPSFTSLYRLLFYKPLFNYYKKNH